MTPYQKVFKIHLAVSLNGEPSGAVNSDVTFEVVIGNVCEIDQISYQETVKNLQYTLISAPNTLRYEDFPIIMQDKVQCPVFCELTTLEGLPVPQGYGISFQSPRVIVQTDNKALNGQSIDLKITCVAPLSKTGPGGTPDVAENPFNISYIDECYNTEIIPA